MTPHADLITTVFDPKRLFSGLVAAPLGGALLVWVLFLSEREARDRVWLTAVGMGALLVVVGVGLIVQSFGAVGCAHCRVALDDTYTFIPFEKLDRVREAVRASGSSVEPLIALGAAPILAFSFAEAASVETEYCPKCMQVARLASAIRRSLPDGNTTAHDLSPAVLVVGDGARRMLDMIGARNEASTMLMMSGGAA